MKSSGHKQTANLEHVLEHAPKYKQFYLGVDRDGVDNVARVVEDGHLAKHELLLHTVVKNNLLTQS